MTTNWVKDGLDAYLAVTGEHRAEKEAEDKRADRQHARSIQEQSLELAKNQDQRSAISADLNNRQTQKKIDDEDKWDKLLFQTTYEKEYANVQTPTAATINDPTQVEASRYVYNNSLKTVEFIKQLPPNMKKFSVPAGQMQDVPAFVRETATFMFTPAAMKRAGQRSTDPATGKAGVITGNMGNILIERDDKGEAYISADMEVKNDDGTIRFAPFTNRTDDPHKPVKRMPLSALAHEANATLQGIDDALKTGIDPSVAITVRKLAGIENWPRELKKKAYLDLMEEDKNMRTRDSDVAITKSVGKKLEALMPTIDALPWKTDPQSAAMQLYTTLSQSGMTTAEAEKALKVVTSAKMPPGKSFKTVEIGAGGDLVQMVTIDDHGKTTPLGKAYPKFARKGSSGTGKEESQTKRDISTRLKGAFRVYEQAQKSGDPDAINEAIDFIESLNDSAKEYGVPPMPLPARPHTTAEESQIKAQAIKNLEGKQTGMRRFFGTKPSIEAVNQEITRLKQTAKPGAAQNPPDGDYVSQLPQGTKSAGMTKDGRPVYQLPNGKLVAGSHPNSEPPPGFKPNGKTVKGQPAYISPDGKQVWIPTAKTAPQQQPRPASVMQTAPPANQHAGRIIKDTQTGKRYRSNGSSWQEVR